MDKRTVLVVSTADIHRSVIAAACLNQAFARNGLLGQLLAISRGLAGYLRIPRPNPDCLWECEPGWWYTQLALEWARIKICCHRSLPATAEMVEHAAVILGMDRFCLYDSADALSVRYPHWRYKMHLFAELGGRECDVEPFLESRDMDQHYEAVTCLQRWATKGVTELRHWIVHPTRGGMSYG